MNLGTRHRNVILLAALAIILQQATEVTPQVINCAKIIMKVAKGIIKLYGICAKEFMAALNRNIREYNRRVDCVMKCVMGHVGVLDDENKVTNDTMQVFFDKYIPEDYHEIGHIMVEGCIEEYSPLMDNEDDLCSAYGDFVKCVQNIISEAC